MTSRSKRSTGIVDPPAPLSCKIDWYSFTLPVAGGIKGHGNDTLNLLDNLLRGCFGNRLDSLEADGTWRLDQAKGFYQWRAVHVGSKVSVSWGEVNSHVFVELPGQACSWARDAGIFDQIVRLTHDRASRVDCAIDILTSTKPSTFVNAGFAKRFINTTGNLRSEQGETYYVGSRKSERFARCYRYAPPHPRCAFLRVEAEYKGKSARNLASILANSGALEAVRSAHRIFDWKSSEMTLDFLQLTVFDLDQVTSLDTVNIAGSTPPYYLPLSVTTKQDWWMLPPGLLTYYRQRFATPKLSTALPY